MRQSRTVVSIRAVTMLIVLLGGLAPVFTSVTKASVAQEATKTAATSYIVQALSDDFIARQERGARPSEEPQPSDDGSGSGRPPRGEQPAEQPAELPAPAPDEPAEQPAVAPEETDAGVVAPAAIEVAQIPGAGRLLVLKVDASVEPAIPLLGACFNVTAVPTASATLAPILGAAGIDLAALVDVTQLCPVDDPTTAELEAVAQTTDLLSDLVALLDVNLPAIIGALDPLGVLGITVEDVLEQISVNITLQEVQVPLGYEANANVSLNVSLASLIYEGAGVTVENYPVGGGPGPTAGPSANPTTGPSTPPGGGDGDGEGTLTIINVSADDPDTRVPGGCFQILDASGAPIGRASCDRDGDGETVIPGLPIGEPLVVEQVSAPEGYLPGDDLPVQLDGPTETVTFASPVDDDGPGGEPSPGPTDGPSAPPGDGDGDETGRLTILNVSPGGDTALVPGGCFQILDEAGAAVSAETCDDDGNGLTTIPGLPIGEPLVITQTSVPEGYIVGDDLPYTLNDPSETVRFVSFVDEDGDGVPDDGDGDGDGDGDDDTGRLTIINISPDGEDALVVGSCFQLFDDAGDALTAEVCDTDNDGLTTISDLPIGEPIVITQTSVPPGYLLGDDLPYELNDPSETVFFVSPADPDGGPSASPSASPSGDGDDDTASIIVLNVDGTDPTQPIGGGCFRAMDPTQDLAGAELAAAAVPYTPIVCDTDFDGVVELPDVPAGVPVTIVQVVAPAGYELADDVTITTEPGAQLVLIESDPLSGEPGGDPGDGTDDDAYGPLTVLTVDPDGNLVPGACFSFDADGPAEAVEACDGDDAGGEDGAVVIGVFTTPGTLSQTVVPTGFVASPDLRVQPTEGDNVITLVLDWAADGGDGDGDGGGTGDDSGTGGDSGASSTGADTAVSTLPNTGAGPAADRSAPWLAALMLALVAAASGLGLRLSATRRIRA